MYTHKLRRMWGREWAVALPSKKGGKKEENAETIKYSKPTTGGGREGVRAIWAEDVAIFKLSGRQRRRSKKGEKAGRNGTSVLFHFTDKVI